MYIRTDALKERLNITDGEVLYIKKTYGTSTIVCTKKILSSYFLIFTSGTYVKGNKISKKLQKSIF